MENKCSDCGGNLVVGKLATGFSGVGFVPKEDFEKIKPRYFPLECQACEKCGKIINFHIQDVQKLK